MAAPLNNNQIYTLFQQIEDPQFVSAWKQLNDADDLIDPMLVLKDNSIKIFEWAQTMVATYPDLATAPDLERKWDAVQRAILLLDGFKKRPPTFEAFKKRVHSMRAEPTAVATTPLPREQDCIELIHELARYGKNSKGALHPTFKAALANLDKKDPHQIVQHMARGFMEWASELEQNCRDSKFPSKKNLSVDMNRREAWDTIQKGMPLIGLMLKNNDITTVSEDEWVDLSSRIEVQRRKKVDLDKKDEASHRRAGGRGGDL